MNYKRIYDQLISKYKNLNLQKCNEIYLEKHHIIPRCMGGTNKKSNLVNLPAKAHFIAHHLLWKINSENWGLVKAFFMMCNVEDKNQYRYRIITSKIYEHLKNDLKIYRPEYSKVCPICGVTIKNKSAIQFHFDNCLSLKMVGKTFGKLTVIKRDLDKQHKRNSYWICKCDCGQIVNRNKSNIKENSSCHSCVWKGKKRGSMSDEQKLIRSEHNKNRTFTEEEKKKISIKISKSQKGKKHSQSHIDAFKKVVNNKPIVKCPHCALTGKMGSAMTRWHFNNCKHKKLLPNK